MADAADRERHPSGAALSREVRARLRRAALVANGLGGLTAFVFGILTPVPFDADDQARVRLLNVGAFVVLMPAAMLTGYAWAGRTLAAPIDRWLAAERPATEAERDVVLGQPVQFVRISGTLWVVAALVFGAVNAIVSPELAATAFVVALLGGATCCAVGYLMVERGARPVLARALGGTMPARPTAPGIAARLTVTWTLVTGVPLAGIAVMALADMAGVRLDESAMALATLFLALAGIVVGLFASVLAARSVADPVRAVRESMARVEAGDFTARVAVDDASEIGLLEAGFNNMAAGLAERERVRDLFGRHVGRDVARAALEGDLRLGGELRPVAVLFVDLVGSTELAARRPAPEVVALLNAFFRLVVRDVEAHGGWVNKFEGDAALCVFGAPAAIDDAPGEALAAARSLRSDLAAELPAIDVGIGVSAGTAVAGNVGAEHRFEYTVIGDPVNEAARLCELAKRRPERLLASGAALAQAAGPESENWALAESVTLRGRDEPTSLATPRER